MWNGQRRFDFSVGFRSLEKGSGQAYWERFKNCGSNLYLAVSSVKFTFVWLSRLWKYCSSQWKRQRNHNCLYLFTKRPFSFGNRAVRLWQAALDKLAPPTNLPSFSVKWSSSPFMGLLWNLPEIVIMDCLFCGLNCIKRTLSSFSPLLLLAMKIILNTYRLRDSFPKIFKTEFHYVHIALQLTPGFLSTCITGVCYHTCVGIPSTGWA